VGYLVGQAALHGSMPNLLVAQVFSSSVGAGTVAYGSTNDVRFKGDTLRIRVGIINTGDTAFAVPSWPCGLRIKSTLDLRPLAPARCAAPRETLVPGDSSWAEGSWEVLSAPGSYKIQMSWLGFGFGTSFLIDSRDSPTPRLSLGGTRQRGRLPIVIDFSNSSTLAVSAEEVRGVAFGAALSSEFFAMIVSSRAADAMSGVAPYLGVRVRLSGQGDHELSQCWMGPAGQLSGSCDQPTTGLTNSPVSFGALQSNFIEREIDFHRRARF
jgi:hypothetical protein